MNNKIKFLLHSDFIAYSLLAFISIMISIYFFNYHKKEIILINDIHSEPYGNVFKIDDKKCKLYLIKCGQDDVVSEYIKCDDEKEIYLNDCCNK